MTGPVVAVVDDDAPFREAMSAMMRASGCKVRTYASGPELLGAPRLSEVGLLLLDVKMREMSGLDLVRRLRALGCETQVIFVTGARDPLTRAAIADIDASILLKPFDPDELIAMVRAAVGSGAS